MRWDLVWDRNPLPVADLGRFLEERNTTVIKYSLRTLKWDVTRFGAKLPTPNNIIGPPSIHFYVNNGGHLHTEIIGLQKKANAWFKEIDGRDGTRSTCTLLPGHLHLSDIMENFLIFNSPPFHFQISPFPLGFSLFSPFTLPSMHLSMLSRHFRLHISACILVPFQTWRSLQ